MSSSSEKVILVKDLETLITAAMEPKRVRFQLREDGPVYELEIRPLVDSELDAANKLTSEVTPPVNQEVLRKSGDLLQSYDFQNVEYKKKFAEANRCRQAYIISTGVVSLSLKQETLAKTAEILEEKLPSRVLNMLQREIEDISSSEVKIVDLANFTSSGGSEVSAS